MGKYSLAVCLGGQEKGLVNKQPVCAMISQLQIRDYLKIPPL